MIYHSYLINIIFCIDFHCAVCKLWYRYNFSSEILCKYCVPEYSCQLHNNTSLVLAGDIYWSSNKRLKYVLYLRYSTLHTYHQHCRHHSQPANHSGSVSNMESKQKYPRLFHGENQENDRM